MWDLIYLAGGIWLIDRSKKYRYESGLRTGGGIVLLTLGVVIAVMSGLSLILTIAWWGFYLKINGAM